MGGWILTKLSAAHVRTVDKGGWLSFKGRVVNRPRAFAGKRLALGATDTDGVFDLCYRSYLLAQVDLRQDQANLSVMSPNTCQP